MKLISNIKLLTISLTALCTLSACDPEEPTSELGNGTPKASNIVCASNYDYQVNSTGLVTRIEDATITYPQSNRAVMTTPYYTYIFAFGDNNYASKILWIDEEGYTGTIDLKYNSQGQLTYFDDCGDKLELEYFNGNLSKVTGSADGDSQYAIFTYTNQNEFAKYSMTPFMLKVNLGGNMPPMNWWLEMGLDYAAYIGFLGKPFTHNLPATVTIYDQYNDEPEKYEFTYTDVLNENGEIVKSYYKQEHIQ